jgi:hypothetical protein
MNSPWRWSVLAVLPLGLTVFAGLSRTHATPRSAVAAIVAPIGRSVTIAAAPGRADAENTFIVSGIQGTALRLLSRSLDMDMGIARYAATPLGNGRWQVSGAEVPMVGRWGITVQVQRNGAWVTVGQVTYAVPFTGMMRLVAAGR